MVAIGSGGAITGKEFIEARLPYTQGLQFITLYHERRGVEIEPIGGTSIARSMV
jgi:hypothetical protein